VTSPAAPPTAADLRALPAYTGPRAEIGVIGGSGLYSFLTDAREVEVATPWGEPSAPLVVGEVSGRQVAFLPRHGRDHRFPPHRVNYRANLWALRTVGVRQVLAPCAVGSLRRELGPGQLVVPDQIVDRTWGRAQTFFDGADGVVHVSLADPYCHSGREVVLSTARARGQHPVDGGTLVVINGPRFSTRAESRWHAAAGWSLVGMTGMPEAALARELAMHYTALALVTDHDAGVEHGEGVTHEEVLRVFAENIADVRDLLHAVVPELPPAPDGCGCAQVHDGVRLPFPLP
jgi:5'-methylthioadenosine phosphorylase